MATSWPRLAADHLNYHNEHRRIYLLHANTLESALGKAVKCEDPVRHASRCASINPCASERATWEGVIGAASWPLGCWRRLCLSACPCDRPAMLDLFANISISHTHGQDHVFISAPRTQRGRESTLARHSASRFPFPRAFWPGSWRLYDPFVGRLSSSHWLLSRSFHKESFVWFMAGLNLMFAEIGFLACEASSENGP